jgi:pilus assembly protein Flp/PilA
MILGNLRHFSHNNGRLINDTSRGSRTGQGLLEYAMILMLVVMVVLVILLLLGPSIGNMYSNIVYNI